MTCHDMSWGVVSGLLRYFQRTNTVLTPEWYGMWSAIPLLIVGDWYGMWSTRPLLIVGVWLLDS